MYKKISGLVVSLTAVFACAASGGGACGLSRGLSKTVDAAVKEGKVVISFHDRYQSGRAVN